MSFGGSAMFPQKGKVPRGQELRHFYEAGNAASQSAASLSVTTQLYLTGWWVGNAVQLHACPGRGG